MLKSILQFIIELEKTRKNSIFATILAVIKYMGKHHTCVPIWGNVYQSITMINLIFQLLLHIPGFSFYFVYIFLLYVDGTQGNAPLFVIGCFVENASHDQMNYSGIEEPIQVTDYNV